MGEALHSVPRHSQLFECACYAARNAAQQLWVASEAAQPSPFAQHERWAGRRAEGADWLSADKRHKRKRAGRR